MDFELPRVRQQGTWTPIHADVLRSYSWSTNIVGRKRWHLLPPEHAPLLYDRFGREMGHRFDAAESAAWKFPNLAKAASQAIVLDQVLIF